MLIAAVIANAVSTPSIIARRERGEVERARGGMRVVDERPTVTEPGETDTVTQTMMKERVRWLDETQAMYDENCRGLSGRWRT